MSMHRMAAYPRLRSWGVSSDTTDLELNSPQPTAQSPDGRSTVPVFPAGVHLELRCPCHPYRTVCRLDHAETKDGKRVEFHICDTCGQRWRVSAEDMP